MPIIRAQTLPGISHTLFAILLGNYSWVFDHNVIDLVKSLLMSVKILLVFFTFACLSDYVPDAKFYKVEAILRCV